MRHYDIDRESQGDRDADRKMYLETWVQRDTETPRQGDMDTQIHREGRTGSHGYR